MRRAHQRRERRLLFALPDALSNSLSTTGRDQLLRVFRRLGIHLAAVRNALIEVFPLILARALGAAGGRVADLARRKGLCHQGVAGTRDFDGNRMCLGIAYA
jgi:hypothetical protein